MSNVIDTTAQDLTDEGYEIADRIDLWLEKHPGLHNRSRIARGAKCESYQAAHILDWMESRTMVAADGNGAWRKYGARR